MNVGDEVPGFDRKITLVDMVAYAGWPMEIHHPDGSVTYEHIGGPGWFGIPYGCLTPVGIDNLWLAGRTVGADALAYASVRVMGTSFATGQAAGCAAAAWLETGTHSIDAVRAVLTQQGALADFTSVETSAS